MSTSEKNGQTVARVAQLLERYTTPDSNGVSVTDEETFAVDIIADVLIWAALESGADELELDTIVGSAIEHARYELDHAQ